MLIVTFSSQPKMVCFAVFIILTYGVLWGTEAVAATKCGQKFIDGMGTRINVGIPSVKGAWPWHGALYHVENDDSMNYVCGFTILAKRHVITAAHCLVRGNEYIPEHSVVVQVGLINLMAPGEHRQLHRVKKIILHEFYNKSKHEDDIALLNLKTAITFNDIVQPICMWRGVGTLENVAGQIGYFVGWGKNEFNQLPVDLYEATAPIISRRECLDSDPEHFGGVYYDRKTFCAGYRNETTANQGDSGSGFYLQINNTWVLRGILSNIKYDSNRTMIDYSSFMMFTDVPAYLDWIKGNVDDPEFNPEPVESIQRVQPISHSTNLLEILTCGVDLYPLGTTEELKTSVSQYPWLAVIEIQLPNLRQQWVVKDVCHGIFIHPNFVLTTASCVKKTGSKARSVLSNVYHLDIIDKVVEDAEYRVTDPNRYWIKKITIHPEFDIPKFANNIALLKLHEPSTVIPICLSPMGSVFPELVSYHVVGWKRTNQKKRPLIRKMAKRKEFGECRKRYSSVGVELDITGSQMCVDYNHSDGPGNCSHYHGSVPLQYVTTNNGRYFLAGLLSLADQCKLGSLPDVFISAEYYGDWIYNEVQQYQNL